MDGVRVSYIVVKSGERWLPRTFPSTDSKKKKKKRKEEMVAEQADTKGSD